MCGIAGMIALSKDEIISEQKIRAAVECLSKRGPDGDGIFADDKVAFGHRRLAVIDTSEAAAQPMQDAAGRYVIIFNGEFFNFREHRKDLQNKGITFRTESDTEVLLYLYILEKEKCLEKINGFFSLAIYDKQESTVFLARDRFGVKPLLYFHDEKYFCFASELKALLKIGVEKVIDESSLLTYLQLNYIPAPDSIFKSVKKLLPGHFVYISLSDNKPKIRIQEYYHVKINNAAESIGSSLEEHQAKLESLMDAAVARRMVSDVPLGSFLSGGIDSSIVSALAARHTSKLQTFSIGFKDEPLFDETYYAELVSKKIKSDHHVFQLTTQDLFAKLHEVLDYTDEPFADSSALNVYILSEKTRNYVTVTLSGDGADELFGGYNKHGAEYKIRQRGFSQNIVRNLSPVWSLLPKSRNSKLSNLFRQLDRYAKGSKLSAKERYWLWAGYADLDAAISLLSSDFRKNSNQHLAEYENRKKFHLNTINGKDDLNDFLLTDVDLVLPNDMLMKVDLMSMANSLEVRTPFLDYTVVDFAFQLPSYYKINNQHRKKILKDTFRKLLPEELYTRKKQGFEVPLLKWFRYELKSFINDSLLNRDFIMDQNIFNHTSLVKLVNQLHSSDPGESVSRVWGLLVFQHWWNKYYKA